MIVEIAVGLPFIGLGLIVICFMVLSFLIGYLHLGKQDKHGKLENNTVNTLLGLHLLVNRFAQVGFQYRLTHNWKIPALLLFFVITMLAVVFTATFQDIGTVQLQNSRIIVRNTIGFVLADEPFQNLTGISTEIGRNQSRRIKFQFSTGTNLGSLLHDPEKLLAAERTIRAELQKNGINLPASR